MTDEETEEERRLQRRRSQPDALSVSFSRLLPRLGPKLYIGVFWWAFGLYALFVARAPFTPSPAAEQAYSDLMQQAVFSEEAREAQGVLRQAQHDLDQVHVLGWRWRTPYDKLVPPRQRMVAEAQGRLNAALRESDALKSEAKSQVGIWSQYGVDEVRERFWTAYQSGKDFAKRMTFWDVMFGVGGGRRDEELVATLLRWLGQIMMNFTIGLVSALFSFAFSLVGMLWEYKVSYLSGALFFAVAMSGASAMVFTFVGGMYATAVGGVMYVTRAAQNARIEGGGAGGRRQQVRYQQRPPGHGGGGAQYSGAQFGQGQQRADFGQTPHYD